MIRSNILGFFWLNSLEIDQIKYFGIYQIKLI